MMACSASGPSLPCGDFRVGCRLCQWTSTADATGDAATAELSALRAKVRAALLNWTPDELPGGEPFRFSRGGLLSFKNAILWWQDQYVTKYILRAV